MKLKLDQLDACQVLCVTESLESEFFPVIQSGLKGILRTTSRPILVDLSSLPVDAVESLQSQWLALKAWAACRDQEVYVVSKVDAVGDVASVAQGLELIASAELRAERRKAAGLRYVARLERQKRALAKQTASPLSLRNLRKVESGLKKRMKFAQDQIALLQSPRLRIAPFSRVSENAPSLLEGA